MFEIQVNTNACVIMLISHVGNGSKIELTNLNIRYKAIVIDTIRIGTFTASRLVETY